MGALAAVCVYDNLAACKTSVAVRATDNKLACRVDKVLDVVVEQGEHLVAVYLRLDARHKDVEHVVLNLGKHALVVVVKLVVLCRHNDGVDALWYALLRVFYRNLALRVGTQIGHLLAFLAYVGKHLHDVLGEVECYRHVVLGLVGSITEHHTLVAGALLFFLGTAYATVDVVALLVYGCEHATRVAVKLILRLVVANLVDGLAGDILQVDVHTRAHLAHDYYLTGCYKRLDSAVCVGVVSQELVDKSVRNLVGYLVRMAF